MTNLFTEEMRRNPFPVYERMRNASPLVQEPQSGLWMVFDYDGAKRVLSDHEAFSSKLRPEWIVFIDPPRHSKLRALISQAFTHRSIANLEPRIRELSRELLDVAAARGEMDLAGEFSIQLPMLVIAEMLGVPAADRPRFRHWNEVLLNMSYTVPGGGEAAGAMEDFRAATAGIDVYLTGLIEERRSKPRDDLLTRLVQAQVD